MRKNRPFIITGTFIVGFMLVLVISCTSVTNNGPTGEIISTSVTTHTPFEVPTSVVTDENSVIQVALKTLFPDADSFLVLNTAQPISEKNEMLGELMKIEDETRTNFLLKNRDATRIRQDLPLDPQLIYTSFSNLRARFGNNDPNYAFELDFVGLREEYPNVAGILELSQIGFNELRTQSLLWIVFYNKWGPCEEGHFVVQTKVEGNWSIQEDIWAEACT